MVKLFRNEYVFEHPWQRMASTFWQKYPNNDYAHVKAVDTFKRDINTKNRTMQTSRLITLDSKVPAYMTALGVPNACRVAEVATVDAKNKSLVLKSRNLTCSSILVVEETCIYRAHPTNPNQTIYSQEARISAFAPIVAHKIESWSLGNMCKNAQRGLRVMEELCERAANMQLELPSMALLNAVTTEP